MPEILWINDVPMPAVSEQEHLDRMDMMCQDDEWDWFNDPNYVGSRHHY
jgi:hypothetical protein